MSYLRNLWLPVLGALVLGGTVASVAVAQEDDSSGMAMKHMHGASSVQGMHKMPATVTAADANTGIVEVNSGGMALKVHFPPAAMKDLKAGDKIILHLGFSRPER